VHIYIGPEAVVYSDKQLVHHSEKRVFISLLPLFSYQLSVIISVNSYHFSFSFNFNNYHFCYQLSVLNY